MSNRNYRSLTLAARGLLYTLRLECWENKSVPADPAELARMLGYSAAEIAATLPSVMPFFVVAGDEIFSPEHDRYRAHLASIRKAQSAGGKRAMKKRYSVVKADE